MFQISLRKHRIVSTELNSENTRDMRVDVKRVSGTRKRALRRRFVRKISRFEILKKQKQPVFCLVDRNVRAHWSRKKIMDYEHVLLRR